MSAVMVGDKNREVFLRANAALADRVWDKLTRAGAVNFAAQNEKHRRDTDKQKRPEPQKAG